MPIVGFLLCIIRTMYKGFHKKQLFIHVSCRGQSAVHACIVQYFLEGSHDNDIIRELVMYEGHQS